MNDRGSSQPLQISFVNVPIGQFQRLIETEAKYKLLLNLLRQLFNTGENLCNEKYIALLALMDEKISKEADDW